MPRSLASSLQSPGLVAALLFALVVLVYAPVKDQEFVDYDDPLHVTDNAAVQEGLTAANFSRAFTTSTSSIWMPVTYLSHALDCQLYGLNPAGHKATNVVLHAVNTVLLFLVLRMMTGSPWAAAFVAALFGVHPLNVETVAWVSERKNLTSTLFFLLTLGAYVRYVRAPRTGRYLAVLALFALSLMAKPMLVTLPFLLLLLDYWPLERRRRGAPAAGSRITRFLDRPDRTLFVRDKIPMLLLVIAASIVAIATQQADAAMARFETLPPAVRVLNALLSYGMYLVKAIWPAHLAAFYPHPLGGVPTGPAALSAVFLVLAGGAIAIYARRLPYLFVGGSWYLGTLVPVIGLVQIGSQSMADRYAYVPLIGVFIAFAWGGAELGRRLRLRAGVIPCAAIVIVAALAAGTRLQLGTWRNSATLWAHALSVTGEVNPIAHYSMGRLLYERGTTGEALHHLRLAVAQAPQFAEARYNLGVALQKEGDLDGAMAQFEAAIALRPSYLKARNNHAVILMQRGRTGEAASHFVAALGFEPRYTPAHVNLGRILAARGDSAKALDHFEQALRGLPPPDPGQEAMIRNEIEKLRRRQGFRPAEDLAR